MGLPISGGSSAGGGSSFSPATVVMTRSAAITTNTGGVQTKVTLDQVASGSSTGTALTGNTSLNRVVANEACKVIVQAQCRPNSAGIASTAYNWAVKKNGTTDVLTHGHIFETPTPTTSARSGSGKVVDLAVNDFLELFFSSTTANTGAGAGADDTFLSVAKVA